MKKTVYTANTKCREARNTAFLQQFMHKAEELEFWRFELETIRDSLAKKRNEAEASLRLAESRVTEMKENIRELNESADLLQEDINWTEIILYACVSAACVFMLLFIPLTNRIMDLLIGITSFGSTAIAFVVWFVCLPLYIGYRIQEDYNLEKLNNEKESIRRRISLLKQDIRGEQEKYNYTNKVLLPLLKRRIETNTKKLNALNMSREKFYRRGILHKAYQELVPVSAMSFYLDAGRCFQLFGNGGAIDKYEVEVRLNSIIVNLEDIRRGVSAIGITQKSLMNRINLFDSNVSGIMRNIDETTGRIAQNQITLQDSVNALERSVNLNRFYNKISAETAAHVAWIEGYSGMPATR